MAEGLASATGGKNRSSAIDLENVLGILKMELGDFRKSLSDLEVKVERLGAAFEEKFSTVGAATKASYESIKEL